MAERYNLIAPPIQGQNVWVIAGLTSSQVFPLPTEWYGARVEFEADGGDFWLAFGSSPTLSVDKAAVGPGAGTCIKIAAGSRKAFDLSLLRSDPARPSHLAIVASATTAVLRAHRISR